MPDAIEMITSILPNILDLSASIQSYVTINIRVIQLGENLTMVVATQSRVLTPAISSLEEWMQNPPDHYEWVDGELVEKNSVTLKHSKLQSKLSSHWRAYKDSSQQGGEVYTDVPCRTQKQGRYPDVAYLTPELVMQFGDADALPQSFPLIAEIVSPTDLAEAVLAKTFEYLQSGADEVWLVYPEARWIIVVTQDTRHIVVSGEIASTQKVLLGFSIAVDELLG